VQSEGAAHPAGVITPPRSAAPASDTSSARCRHELPATSRTSRRVVTSVGRLKASDDGPVGPCNAITPGPPPLPAPRPAVAVERFPSASAAATRTPPGARLRTRKSRSAARRPGRGRGGAGLLELQQATPARRRGSVPSAMRRAGRRRPGRPHPHPVGTTARTTNVSTGWSPAGGQRRETATAGRRPARRRDHLDGVRVAVEFAAAARTRW